MEPVPDETGPDTSAPRQRGWFMRLPLWLRIVAPAVLLVLLVGGTATAVIVASQPTDPLARAQAICLSGVRAELEGRDRDILEMPLFRDVSDVGDGTYRAQGQVRFTEADGAERRVTVRCIARLEDGRMRVSSIRFST